MTSRSLSNNVKYYTKIYGIYYGILIQFPLECIMDTEKNQYLPLSQAGRYRKSNLYYIVYNRSKCHD